MQKITESKSKFKISLEVHGKKITIEKDHDDLTIWEMAEIFKSLLLSASWSQELIERILPLDDEIDQT